MPLIVGTVGHIAFGTLLLRGVSGVLPFGEHRSYSACGMYIAVYHTFVSFFFYSILVRVVLASIAVER